MTMFDLRANRIGYSSDLLVPPEGFHFERAVVTTYSLDLETLLATLIPLVIGKTGDRADEEQDAEERQGRQVKNEKFLLQALKETHLTVFYQAGQIHVPRHDTALFALLDRMLVPVMLEPIGKEAKSAASRGDKETIPSFHPKTWTIEYKNDSGESFCRFAVLSRNLTFDSCLDISFAVESDPDEPNTGETRCLCDFLSFLDESLKRLPKSPARENHHELIENLKKALCKHPLGLGKFHNPWKSFEILPLIPGSGSAKSRPAQNGEVHRRLQEVHRKLLNDPLFSEREPEPREKPQDVVIISPFLSDTVVSRIANRIQKPDDASMVPFTWPDASATLPDDSSPGAQRNPDCKVMIPNGSALVTRPESFASLPEEKRPSPKTLPAWALMGNASPAQADEAENLVPHDSGLHAKIYLWRRPREMNLLFGSMNATYSGLHRNAEMVVRLRCNPRSDSYRGKDMLEDLFGKGWWQDDSGKKGPVNPFKPISVEDFPSSDETRREQERKQAQEAIRDFCSRGAAGWVEQNGEDFAVIIDIPDTFAPPEGTRCSIRPLQGGKAQSVAQGTTLRFDGLRLADLSDFFLFSVFFAETSAHTVSHGGREIPRIVQLPVKGIVADGRYRAVRADVVAKTGGWKDYFEIYFAEDAEDAFWTAVEQDERRESAGGAQSFTEGLPPGLYEKMLRTVRRDDALKHFQDAKTLLEGQADRDADKVRELLEVFINSLSTGRKRK